MACSVHRITGTDVAGKQNSETDVVGKQYSHWDYEKELTYVDLGDQYNLVFGPFKINCSFGFGSIDMILEYSNGFSF